MLTELLSRKFLLTIGFSILGFYLVMTGKLDAGQFMIALGANLGVYATANTAESIFNNTIKTNDNKPE